MSLIIVVEPQPLLRLGILHLLNDVVAGCTLEGADYSALHADEPANKQCDLLLLSIPCFSELEHIAENAKRVYSPKSMLLMADHDEIPSNVPSLPSYISGYVRKSAAPEVLQASVRLVLAGGTCFPLRAGTANGHSAERLSDMPLTTVKWPPADTKDTQSLRSTSAMTESEMLGLTPRQYEVLVLLARGYPMKTVGRYLNISVATAKAHTETLYQRLDVHNRNAAVYAAVSRGATLGLPNMVKPAAVTGNSTGMRATA